MQIQQLQRTALAWAGLVLASSAQQFERTPGPLPPTVGPFGGGLDAYAEDALALDPDRVASANLLGRSVGLSADADELVGGGPGYGVRFDREGFQFTPALGERAARDLPVRFHLESIELGGRALALDLRAAPRAEGSLASFERGAGVVERYELLPEGVEQSFLLHERPVGAGELVVRGRLSSELLPDALGVVSDGLGLRHDGMLAVEWGGVLGIDAEGVRRPGELRFDGTHLELVLPADFVAQARFPLLVDPLIGIGTDVAAGGDSRDPDVAFDDSSGNYVVVWEERFSALNSDVRAQRVNDLAQPVGGLIFVEAIQSEVGLNPTIANSNLGNAMLVVWQTGPSIFGPWDLKCRTLDPANGSLSNVLSFGNSQANDIHPDAGGDATLVDNDCLVVWEEENAGIRGAQIQTVAGFPALVSFFDVSFFDGDGRPAISKSGGASGNHLVVWQRDQGLDHDIVARPLDRDGNSLDFEEPVIQSFVVDEMRPDVDGNGSDWLVAYEHRAAVGGTDPDIRARHMRLAAGLIQPVGPEIIVEADFNDPEIDPAVGFVGPMYLVTYSDLHMTTGPINYSLGCWPISAADYQICGIEQAPAGTSPNNRGPEVATRLSGSTSETTDALIAWEAAANTPPFDGDVRAHRWRAFVGGPVTNIGGGCGEGGAIGFQGLAAVGNPDFELSLKNAGLGAVLGILNLSGPFPTIDCGSCSWLPFDLTFAVPLVAGAAGFPFPIPCDSGLAGKTLHAQWTVAFTSASPCALAPNVSFSDRLEIQIEH